MLGYQKYVYVLDDFHYRVFCSFLLKTKAALPLKLTQTLREFGPRVAESDDLCNLIYNEVGEKEKKRLIQLMHHSFKLTGYLSRNFPDFLAVAFHAVQKEFYQGNKGEALLKLDCIFDIARKVEDFSVLEKWVQFKLQFHYMKDRKDVYKQWDAFTLYHDLSKRKANYGYAILHGLLKHQRETAIFDASFVLEVPHDLHNETYVSLAILAKLKSLVSAWIFHPESLIGEANDELLKKLEKEYGNNAFLVFPFPEDVWTKILSLKLQQALYLDDPASLLKIAMELEEQFIEKKFWTHVYPEPLLFSMDTQLQFFLRHYAFSYFDEVKDAMEPALNRAFYALMKKCSDLLSVYPMKEEFLFDYILVRKIQAGAAIISNKKECEKGISILEETLVTYQQIPFQRYLDSIFQCLMVGYFKLGMFEKAVDAHKRYKKVMGGMLGKQECEFVIQALYYMSQYRLGKRNQYVDKLTNLLHQHAHDAFLRPFHRNVERLIALW